MTAFLRANWKGLLVGAAVATVATWLLKPCPQPAVKLVETAHAEKAVAATTEQHKAEAPVRVVVRRFASACAGQPPALVEERTTERGPVVTDTTTAKAERQAEDRKLDLTVTPFEKHYSVLIGAQLFPDLRPALGGAVRLPSLPLLGTWWVQADLTPRLDDPLRSEVRGFLRKDF